MDRVVITIRTLRWALVMGGPSLDFDSDLSLGACGFACALGGAGGPRKGGPNLFRTLRSDPAVLRVRRFAGWAQQGWTDVFCVSDLRWTLVPAYALDVWVDLV